MESSRLRSFTIISWFRFPTTVAVIAAAMWLLLRFTFFFLQRFHQIVITLHRAHHTVPCSVSNIAPTHTIILPVCVVWRGGKPSQYGMTGYNWRSKRFNKHPLLVEDTFLFLVSFILATKRPFRNRYNSDTFSSIIAFVRYSLFFGLKRSEISKEMVGFQLEYDEFNFGRHGDFACEAFSRAPWIGVAT